MLKILLIPLFLMFHPVHVTLTSIDQIQDSDTMKVFFRMYYDDFLRDYKLYDPDSNIEELSVGQSFPDYLINKYFNAKVHIYVNNKLRTGTVAAMSIQDNEIFLNLIFISDKDPKRIRIRNQILTGLYADQTNMVFITINKNKQAMRLTPGHDKESLTFEK